MAIISKESISFSDQRIRIAADRMVQNYNILKSVVDEWTARSMSSLIPNEIDNMLHDAAYGTNGEDGDGRPVVDGAMLHNIINRAQEIVADYELNDNAKLNTLLSVAVNTGV